MITTKLAGFECRARGEHEGRAYTLQCADDTSLRVQPSTRTRADACYSRLLHAILISDNLWRLKVAQNCIDYDRYISMNSDWRVNENRERRESVAAAQQIALSPRSFDRAHMCLRKYT